MPGLYLITGSNGAGKSTIGINYLPHFIQANHVIFDGDKLFVEKTKELYPKTTRSYKEAKKLAYEWLLKRFDSLVENALSNHDNFVYEGHFTNDATWDVPKRFKLNGYAIHLIFFGLSSPDLSELRVINRTKEGGHYVSRFEIESNFYGNLQKLDQYFELIDDLQIVDTSETNHVVLAHYVKNKIISVVPIKQLPEWFTTYLPCLYAKLKA